MKVFGALLLTLLAASQLRAQTTSTHNVLFELDSHKLRPNDKAALDSWLSNLSPNIKRLEIVGHADHLGSIEHNLELSQRRANAVMLHIEKYSGLKYGMSLVSAVGEEFSDASKNPILGTLADRKVTVTAFFEAETTRPAIKQADKNVDQLSDLHVGESLVLKNLNFFPGQHILVPQAEPELLRLTAIMLEHPSIKIEIQGHICCKLDSIDGFDIDTRTYSLSYNRAKLVHDHLVSAGVDPQRLKFKGLAGSRPLRFPELTQEDRNLNRRVEILLLEK